MTPYRQTIFALIFIGTMSSSPSSPAQSAKIIDRLPVEVVASIVWQGKELELRKLISCDQRRRMHPGTEADRELRVREVWNQSMSRVYHVMPSGEVLIFELPVVCREFEKAIGAVSESFLPLTTWVDNARAPKAAEQIVSHRYFRDNPKRRFEFRKFTMAIASSGLGKIDDDQRLVWLLGSAGKPDAYFAGVSVAAFPKEIWGQFAPLAGELQRRNTGLIERGLIEAHARALLSACESRADGIGPAPRCIFGQFDDRLFVASASQTSRDVWTLDAADAGVKRYQHLVDAARLDSAGCNPSFPTCNLFKGTYRFVVRDKSYEIAKSRGDLVFDAERQLLMQPRFSIVSSTNLNTNRADQ